MSDFVSYDQLRKSWNLDEKKVRKGVRKLLALVDGVMLSELRQAKFLTQAQMAKKLKIDQSNVSRIERGSFDTIEVRTLRKYVEALGGQLEIRVTIDEKSQRLIDSEYEKRLERQLARRAVQRSTGRRIVAKKRVRKAVGKKASKKPYRGRQA